MQEYEGVNNIGQQTLILFNDNISYLRSFCGTLQLIKQYINDLKT